MADWTRTGFLGLNDVGYHALRTLLFRRPAQAWHESIEELLSGWDANPAMQSLCQWSHKRAFPQMPTHVGGVNLPYPMMLAAGFVKGLGFSSEREALAASHETNIIPGWRTMPALVGPVEFGSYTRYPRLGNPGTVIWRHTSTQSTQNRIGLRNPGAVAAAAFLGRHATDLPDTFGINIAVSPGVDDIAQQREEIVESLAAFVGRGVHPSWFTLNVSCPNTEDDPENNQTETLTRELCATAVTYLRENAAQTNGEIPLWVKIGPELAPAQYSVLMRIFHEVGVRAVIATNTLPRTAPIAKHLTAGIGGGDLHHHAVNATRWLMQDKHQHRYNTDVIGCGGVMDGTTYNTFQRQGAQAMQYWSALIYRGPLAAALILNESSDE